MTMYFAVYATRRADLSEWIVSLVSTEALARVVAWRFMGTRPGLLRCRVRRVHLTLHETFDIVRQWGRDDAIRGSLANAAERLPQPYRKVYLDAYMDAWKRGG